MNLINSVVFLKPSAERCNCHALDDLASEEEEAADMIPESFEERKSEMEDNAGYIQDAAESVRYAVESLEEIEGVI